MEKKVLWAIIGILALFVVFGFGVLLGGGAVYLWTQPKPLRLEAVVKPNLPMEQEDGVLIRSVITGSPADKAGLVRGDIILKINGEQVNAFRELQNELGQMQPGDKVSLTVYHGDDAQTVKVTLGERNGQAYLGVLPCSVQPMGAIDQGLPGKGGLGGMGWLESGALVLKVEEGSPAQEAGLQVGDLIVRVNQEQINAEQNLGELLSRYKPGDEITLEIQRPGEEDKVQVEVKLGENLKKPKIPYLGIHYRLIGIQGRNIPQYPMIPYNGKEMPFDWFHLPQNGIQ
ncbi:MAG TPA: PDZ domain-containing protein, partial [Anaerolineae bacterium]|nr:PDZ domain-containing protein [Anaerolineae bacterium]